MARPLEELLSDEDAWPDVVGWTEASAHDVEVVPARREDGERTLLSLQVTTRSVLGATAYHAAVVRVDHGWVRLLGAGSPDIAVSLADPLAGGEAPPFEHALLIAYDAVGGFFAVNGGGLPGEPGHVLYLQPDDLTWLSFERGHEDWLRWLLDADLGEFYDGVRWPGWETDAAALPDGRTAFFSPPLFLKPDDGKRHRGTVPVSEAWHLAHDFRGQLGIED